MTSGCYSLFLIILLALSLGFIGQEVLQQENYSLEEQTK